MLAHERSTDTTPIKREEPVSGSIEFYLKKPFSVLAEMNRNEEWRTLEDLNL